MLIESIDENEMWSILANLKVKKGGSPRPMNELHSHFDSILNNVPKNIPGKKLKLLEYTDEKKLAKTLKNGIACFRDGVINEVIKNSIQ